jgi:methylthioribose-1-phosphate isomerase
MIDDIESKLNFATLEWRREALRLIDQRQLPDELSYFDCCETADFVFAIKELIVRGAPAIGIAAAYGIALAAKRGEPLEAAAQSLKATRPTAVNLAWAVDRMLKIARKSGNNPETLEREAIAIHNEDALMCRRIGEHGAALIKDGANILTHCNAGTLATGGIGTALGVIYTAHFSDKKIHVWVDETRPVLQGARLTAWELGRAGVPHTLICDNMAASLIAQGKVDCVIVGADRIAANHDIANKIGTYNLAVLCAHHKIPFYVAAPSTTFDSNCPDGSHVIIEQRPIGEVRSLGGIPIAPETTAIYNPAFDITPHDLITAIITEKGIVSYRR